MEKKRQFSLRSFTSFSLVISTIIMSWSGFILYVAPPGRIANWGSWKLMLFTKAEWQALHTIFSYLFFILVIVHLFFVNWKTFLTYFRSKIRSGLNKKWELLSASLLSILIFIGTLNSWTPFGPVMTFGEKVKAGWEGKFVTAPVLHMEEYTLEKISSELIRATPQELLRTLTGNNIKASGTDISLKIIARENDKTPSEIYKILTSEYQKNLNPVQGETPQGIGKYTIKATSESTGKDINTLLQILKDKGIEADSETTLRSIADELGVTPRDVYNILIEK